MSIPFQCPCGRAFTARVEDAGRKAKCPTCGHVSTIPAPPIPPSTDRKDPAISRPTWVRPMWGPRRRDLLRPGTISRSGRSRPQSPRRCSPWPRCLVLSQATQLRSSAPATPSMKPRSRAFDETFKQQRAEMATMRQAWQEITTSGMLAPRPKSAALNLASKGNARMRQRWIPSGLLSGCPAVPERVQGNFEDRQSALLRIPWVQGYSPWGQRYQGAYGDQAAFSAWCLLPEFQEFSIPDTLLAGHWNEVEIVLEGQSRANSGNFGLEVITNTVALMPAMKPGQ